MKPLAQGPRRAAHDTVSGTCCCCRCCCQPPPCYALPCRCARGRASPFPLHCIAIPAPCSLSYASSRHYCRPASDPSVAYMLRQCSGSAVRGTGVRLSVPARPKLASSPTVDQAPGPRWKHVLPAIVRATNPFPVHTCPHHLSDSIKATKPATSRCIRNPLGLPVERLTGVAGTVCVQVRPPG